jgi:hypothetical protein
MNLIFFVGSLKCANYRERLIRRRRISGRHVPPDFGHIGQCA